MELKKYQERVIADSRAYLNALASQLNNGNAAYGSLAAWED